MRLFDAKVEGAGGVSVRADGVVAVFVHHGHRARPRARYGGLPATARSIARYSN